MKKLILRNSWLIKARMISFNFFDFLSNFESLWKILAICRARILAGKKFGEFLNLELDRSGLYIKLIIQCRYASL